MSIQQAEIVSGSRWREISSGRIIVIIDPMTHDTGPSWRWEDGGSPGEVNWHYCDLADFLLWKRFELVK